MQQGCFLCPALDHVAKNLTTPACHPPTHSPTPCPQLYSPAGRHLTAPLKLGAGIARLACDSAWRLLALTTSGAVRLFDAEALRSLLNVSLAPLLEDGCTGEWLFCGVLQPPC